MSDSLQTRLLNFANSEDTDSKWAVVTAIREILKMHAPDPKSAARLALALFKVIPCADASIMSEAAKLLADLVPLEGMEVLAQTQCAQILEWLEGMYSWNQLD